MFKELFRDLVILERETARNTSEYEKGGPGGRLQGSEAAVSRGVVSRWSLPAACTSATPSTMPRTKGTRDIRD